MKRYLLILLTLISFLCGQITLAESSYISEVEAIEPMVEETGCVLESNSAIPEEHMTSEASTKTNEGVLIDKSTFPDKGFRNYVKKHFDKDLDGTLSDDEIKSVKTIAIGDETEYISNDSLFQSIDCTPVACKSLKGIEYFSNLSILICKSCGLKKLDIKKNTNLRYLNCSNNSLSALDLSRNTQLAQLDCDNNKLKKIDIKKNTKLVDLSCNNNRLKTIDTSKCLKLKALRVASNKLTTIDIKKNTKLEALWVASNQLKALNLSMNKALRVLYAYGNAIASIDIKNNTKLRKWLKQETLELEDVISWGYTLKREEDDGMFWEVLSINKTTKLTAGKKVLYSSPRKR